MRTCEGASKGLCGSVHFTRVFLGTETGAGLGAEEGARYPYRNAPARRAAET